MSIPLFFLLGGEKLAAASVAIDDTERSFINPSIAPTGCRRVANVLL